MLAGVSAPNLWHILGGCAASAPKVLRAIGVAVRPFVGALAEMKRAGGPAEQRGPGAPTRTTLTVTTLPDCRLITR
jgi:hypothetical protein